MNRSDLIERLSNRNSQLQLKDTDLAVKVILEALADALSTGKRIEIRGFGSFVLNYKPPRIGRNPKTGERVNVPEKYAPHFKAGKDLRDRANKNAKILT